MAIVRVIDLEDEFRPAVEQQLQQICAPIDAPELVLTRTTAHILLESVRQLQLKQSEKTTLSTSTVFLTTLLIARQLAQSSPASADDPVFPELSVLHGWGAMLNGDYGERLDRLTSQYFVSIPAPSIDELDTWTTRLEVDAVRCGPGFSRAMAAAGRAGLVRLDQLIFLFLDDPGSGIAKRLSHPDDDSNALEAALRATMRIREGRAIGMSREAGPDELALRIDEYALALSTVLRAAKGEFTFALFGPWGSGKTTLARLLEPLLSNPVEYIKRARAREEPYARRSYSIVVHNAWKYRARPESWIYAYRSLADKANTMSGPIARMLLALRVSMIRKGPWPLTGALLALGISAIPLTAKAQIAALAISFTGFFAFIYLASLTTRVSTKVHDLFLQHLRLAAVDEKLGMLALVGDDVKALLQAWTRPLENDPDDGARDEFPWARLSLPFGLIVAVAVVWAIGLLGGSNWIADNSISQWASSLLPHAWEQALVRYTPRNVPEGLPIGELLVFLAWCTLAFVMVPLPWLVAAKRPNRVLMIIDDLDRCSPAEMLDTIEGMKLLVDDPAISNRLQVLMLVDEAVLGHAIGLRYQTMVDERARQANAGDLSTSRNRAQREVIAEQNEKLFACHLRLPQLSDTDLTDIVGHLAGREIEALRRQRRKAERDRRLERYAAAEQALEKAHQEARSVEESYASIRDGRPVPLEDENGPSSRPLPMVVAMRTGAVDGVHPPSSDEVKARQRRNEQIRARNAAVAQKSPQERLSEHPKLLEMRERTANARTEAEERLRALKVEEIEHVAKGDEPPLFDETDVRFSAREVEELQRLVPEYLRTIERRASPRAVRILLFKIQLCRHLLQLRYPRRPQDMRSIEAILAAFKAAAHPTPGNHKESENVIIARQVV